MYVRGAGRLTRHFNDTYVQGINPCWNLFSDLSHSKALKLQGLLWGQVFHYLEWEMASVFMFHCDSGLVFEGLLETKSSLEFEES